MSFYYCVGFVRDFFIRFNFLTCHNFHLCHNFQGKKL